MNGNCFRYRQHDHPYSITYSGEIIKAGKASMHCDTLIFCVNIFSNALRVLTRILSRWIRGGEYIVESKSANDRFYPYDLDFYSRCFCSKN
jgi:hypothetical protein